MVDRDLKGRFLKKHSLGKRFKEGQIPWNKGIKIDRNKFPNMGFIGKEHSKETKEKNRITHLGNKNSKGCKWTKEQKEKLSKAKKGLYSDSKHPNWDGGSANYYRTKARKLMETKGYNILVHHIDGDFTNNNLNNLQVMTRSEHTKLHWEQNDIRGGD